MALYALLTSGRHSGEYYDCTFILQKAFASKIVAHQLALRLGNIDKTDWIIGPSFGAIFLVSHIADEFNCFHAITEKKGDTQEWNRFEIPDSKQILVQIVEDVITSGGSSFKTLDAIKNGNRNDVQFYKRLAAIINRSGRDSIGDFQIVSLLNPNIPIYIPDECPFCALGSEVTPMKPYLVKKYGAEVCS